MHFRQLRALGLACLALPLLACNSSPARGGNGPALVAEVTRAGTEEMQRLIGEAMGGVAVTLSADAFTESSLLVIERNPPRSLANPRPGGRELTPPARFRLLLDEGRCWLQRLPDGMRRPLESVRCEPEPVDP